MGAFWGALGELPSLVSTEYVSAALCSSHWYVVTGKRVCRLIVEIILATDMANHSEVVDRFSVAMRREDQSDWDSWKPESRVLAMKMLVHCADLGNPCKPPAAAGMWARAVYDEFFRQGDSERVAGLPVTPLFDRYTVCIPASQVRPLVSTSSWCLILFYRSVLDTCSWRAAF